MVDEPYPSLACTHDFALTYLCVYPVIAIHYMRPGVLYHIIYSTSMIYR